MTPINTGDDPDSWLEEIEHYLVTGMVAQNRRGSMKETRPPLPTILTGGWPRVLHRGGWYLAPGSEAS